MLVKGVRAPAAEAKIRVRAAALSRPSAASASVLTLCLGTLGCLALSGCATGPAALNPKDPKYGVSASGPGDGAIDPSVSRHGVAMIGKSYQVAGRRYVPREVRGYTTVGMASWYGSDFHGRRTANGEIFDMHDITAAHPTLPLPCYARVTNTVNGDSIVVRVNDRGPYHGGRVIDLSRRAADLLAFRQQGVGRVKVEYLGKAEPDKHDAQMLLATLRTDGSPAPMPDVGGSDTMVAEAPVPPAPVPEVTPAQAEAAASTLVAAAEPAPPPAAGASPMLVAAYQPVQASMASVPLPPVRPGEATGDLASAEAAPAITPAQAAPAVLPAVATQADVLAAQTASYSAGALAGDLSLDLATIPNAATPIPGKATRVKVASPGQIPLPPQRSADAGLTGRLVHTQAARLRLEDVVGTAATLGDTPMVTTALAYADEPAAPPASEASSPAHVQGGVFVDRAAAEQARWVLSQTGDVRMTSFADEDGHALWRVEAGPFADLAAASAAAAMARSAGAPGASVVN